ncbi:MAG: hypothetical protein IPN79_07025 [Saprospiraceae bacterium]|nr:hypothetical protein [Saprospiraceae bacterium]
MQKIILGIALIVLSLSILGFRVYKGVILKQNVTGHLKRAGDANTIDLAKEELNYVINFLDKNNIKEGYTSILWKTPDEDVTFWYKNLVASKAELDNYKGDSALEKTNILMKLRETLIDDGEKTKVTIPPGLSVFPDNKRWAAFTVFALFAGLLGLTLLIPKDTSGSQKPAEGGQPTT